MMLHELRGTRPGRRLRWRSPTIHEDAPEVARTYPRLAHIEFIFDHTCDALAGQRAVAPCEVARDVGLWMAAEVEAEINFRAEPLYVPSEWEQELELQDEHLGQPA
jgi:hypothetical protein